jgi:two-component system chemotaxis response regulator CheY
MKVLVIDDSAVIRSAVRLALAPEGFEIVEAKDGQEGLDALSRGDVALAICDVNMPVMNGLEMLAAAAKKGLKTPVVMLTTESQRSLVDRAKQSGAKGWMIKPFKPEMLLAAVKRLTAAAS